MKRLLFTITIALFALNTFATSHSTDTAKMTDSVKLSAKDAKHKNFRLRSGGDDEVAKTNDTTIHHEKAYPKFSLGITVARLDLGLATVVDNGSFTLRPQNQFLSYRSWKTSNVGFDLLQMGARFSDSFKLYLSAGLDWTNIRLREPVTILPHQSSLSYEPSNLTLSKNRFSSTYLRLPLSFDFRTRVDANGNRFHFVIGPDAGLLLTASVKQISSQDGKQKVNDSFNYTTFRYGAFTRVGYGAWGIFAKYYFNNMYENSPQQDGLKNFSFGIMLGF